MKLPANARKLQETAEAAGWLVTIEEDHEGRFRQHYDDGSRRDFENCQIFVMHVYHEGVMLAAGWMKNPVSKRWIQTTQVVSRIRGRDEYVDDLTYTVNEALGLNVYTWEWDSVSELIELLKTDDADMLSHRIQQWGRETTDDTD